MAGFETLGRVHAVGEHLDAAHGTQRPVRVELPLSHARGSG